MYNRRFCFVAAALAFASSLSGALTWPETELALRPRADGTLPVVGFAFRNETGGSVTITQVQPTCDCTTVELAQKTYAPGEKGSITARLDPKGLSGLVRRTITVSTDEPGSQPQVLTLIADLPEAITYAPHELRWRTGEKPLAKTVDVLVNVPGGIALETAWANDPNFKVELVAVVARSHYRVKVTPPETTGPLQAVILLRANGSVPPGAGLTFSARVQ